jgi:sterol desaturase/sphingolipid hydroxylase (fatty acid hydroxylase superfamily)
VSSDAQAIRLTTRKAHASGAPFWLSAGLVILCLACLVLFVAWAQLKPLMVESCTSMLNGSARCDSVLNKVRIYALSLGLFPLILLLERWKPADEYQPAFSSGLVVDCFWFLVFPVLGVWLPTIFEEFLHATFGTSLSAFQLPLLPTLPLTLQIVLVILLSDFLAWFSHVIRHKVSFLWELHKIHHSQTQLNYFSSVRLHPLDLVANAAIRFLPFTLLGMQMAVPAFLGWIAFQRFYEMFVHANLRTNMGWLRFVLVTPQSHRIHHSMQHEHIDKNFGNIFSIWDFIFGTQVIDSQVYPETGIGDTDVPLHDSAHPLRAARIFLRELFYPFFAFARPKR